MASNLNKMSHSSVVKPLGQSKEEKQHLDSHKFENGSIVVELPDLKPETIQKTREVIREKRGGTFKIIVVKPTLEAMKDLDYFIEKLCELEVNLAGICLIRPPPEFKNYMKKIDFLKLKLSSGYKEIGRRSKTTNQFQKYDVPELKETFGCFLAYVEAIHETDTGVHWKTGLTAEKFWGKDCPSPNIQQNIIEDETELSKTINQTCSAFYSKYLTSKQPFSIKYATDVEGSLMNDTASPFASWHMGIMSTRLEEICSNLPGIDKPYLYFAVKDSLFPFHIEDVLLFSLNLLHFGEAKVWHAIPLPYKHSFEDTIRTLFPLNAKQCPQFIQHKNLMIHPGKLRDAGIEVNTVLQQENDFILTFPGGYHQGFSMGPNIAEAVNLSGKTFAETTLFHKPCVCEYHRKDESLPVIDTLPFLKKHLFQNHDENFCSYLNGNFKMENALLKVDESTVAPAGAFGSFQAILATINEYLANPVPVISLRIQRAVMELAFFTSASQSLCKDFMIKQNGIQTLLKIIDAFLMTNVEDYGIDALINLVYSCEKLSTNDDTTLNLSEKLEDWKKLMQNNPHFKFMLLALQAQVGLILTTQNDSKLEFDDQLYKQSAAMHFYSGTISLIPILERAVPKWLSSEYKIFNVLGLFALKSNIKESEDACKKWAQFVLDKGLAERLDHFFMSNDIRFKCLALDIVNAMSLVNMYPKQLPREAASTCPAVKRKSETTDYSPIIWPEVTSGQAVVDELNFRRSPLPLPPNKKQYLRFVGETDIKKWSCNIEGCTPYMDDLRRFWIHMVSTHKDLKGFENFPKNFPMFRCTICPELFSRQDLRGNHLNTHHPGEKARLDFFLAKAKQEKNAEQAAKKFKKKRAKGGNESECSDSETKNTE